MNINFFKLRFFRTSIIHFNPSKKHSEKITNTLNFEAKNNNVSSLDNLNEKDIKPLTVDLKQQRFNDFKRLSSSNINNEKSIQVAKANSEKMKNRALGKEANLEKDLIDAIKDASKNKKSDDETPY